MILFLIAIRNIHSETNPYRQLPPLHTLDNYDDCFIRSDDSAKYCLLFGEIEADNSELWHQIEEYSKDTVHRYRHDYIFMGLCVDKCMEMLNNSDSNIRKSNINNRQQHRDLTTYDEIIQYYQRIYKTDSNVLDVSEEYAILDKCANFVFQIKYNLTLRTFVEYCKTYENTSSFQIGYLEAIGFLVLLLLILFNVASSIYDYHLKCKQTSSTPATSFDYYSKSLDSKGSILTSVLTSFSIARNYKKLTSSNDDHQQFQFTYLFRVFTMFFVIWAHALMLVLASPLENPLFIEEFLQRSVTMLFQNGSTLIQIFFILTGFFMKLKFDGEKPITPQTKYNYCVLVYVDVFLQRYLRLLPSLALLILFNVTLLSHLGNGPMWTHIVEGERVFCSQYWWKNIFMINNFMMEDSCAHHTWYLAADCQLFELYLIILIVTAKFKWSKKYLYILLGLCAIIIPGVLTYNYQLQPIPRATPEYYRYFYFQNSETYYKTYFPFYCNLGGYLMGIICAEIYANSSKFQELKRECGKYAGLLKVQVPFLLIMMVIGFGILLSGLIFDSQSIQESSVWVALYAAFYRNLWIIFGGIALMSMILKFGWIAYDIANLNIFRILGRLTFQMYLWHINIVRLLFGFYRQPFYVNAFFAIGQIILAFILSAIVAFFVALLVEYPMSNIVNVLFKKARRAKSKDVVEEMKSDP
ncbi:nose resistant to fluoxetine protein 6 [Musca vetustissima]|uniref:nose resistant to fluoxetine protein 6 n=1 Tax=Musca vetustissima TaxID=27455 RepID=UPI002AB7EAE0|nr:nose resistant to fluoxetine protein 6 [Musca vetustissima]